MKREADIPWLACSRQQVRVSVRVNGAVAERGSGQRDWSLRHRAGGRLEKGSEGQEGKELEK